MRARKMNTEPPAAIMHAGEREINLFDQVIAAQTHSRRWCNALMQQQNRRLSARAQAQTIALYMSRVNTATISENIDGENKSLGSRC
jgi:hypothetical protein